MHCCCLILLHCQYVTVINVDSLAVVVVAMCTTVLVITTVTAPNINDPVTLFWRANLSQQLSSTAWLATPECTHVHMYIQICACVLM